MHKWSSVTDWGPKGDRGDTPRFCKPSQPKRLGQGAFKKVFRAYDCIQGEEVAWSEIGIGHLSGSDRGKILREVKMMKQLKHKNLIELIDQWFDTENNKVVLITAMGVPLRKFVERWSGAIELSLVRKWARDVVQGLKYIHSRGVVHRDMKMENLLLVKGKIVITDYGLARELASAADTRMTSYIGTPAFMAPELYQDEGYDNKVDIYAFGMVLLEMITAEMPYAECGGAPAKIMFKVMNGSKPSGLRKIRCAAARQLIEACISKDPKQRPSAEELLQESSFFHVDDEYLYAASRPYHTAGSRPKLTSQNPEQGQGQGEQGQDQQGHVPSDADGGNGAEPGTTSNNSHEPNAPACPVSPPNSKKKGVKKWLPPILVYDPLQVELRHQLQQQRELDPQQGGLAVAEAPVDKGDDLGPELNIRYGNKVQEAAMLAEAIIKDFNRRVDELCDHATEVVNQQALQEAFESLPSTQDDDKARELIKAEIPGELTPDDGKKPSSAIEDKYASVMMAARDFVNGVPLKMSDQLRVCIRRNQKNTQAYMTNWFVQKAFRAVARSMADDAKATRSVDGWDGQGTSTPSDDKSTKTAPPSEAPPASENPARGGPVGAGTGVGTGGDQSGLDGDVGWDNLLQTLPYNNDGGSTVDGGSVGTDVGPRGDFTDWQSADDGTWSAAEENGSQGRAVLTQDQLTQHKQQQQTLEQQRRQYRRHQQAKRNGNANGYVSDGSSQGGGQGAVVHRKNSGRSDLSNGGQHNKQRPQQQQPRAPSPQSTSEAKGMGRGRSRSRTNTDGTVSTDVGQDEDVFAVVDGGRHRAATADTSRTQPANDMMHNGSWSRPLGRVRRTASTPVLPVGGAAGASPGGIRSPHENGARGGGSSSSNNNNVDDVLPVDGEDAPGTRRKDSDPFGFVNLFGDQTKPARGKPVGRTNGHLQVHVPGERSPAMLLDEGVIAAISPSGKIQVDGKKLKLKEQAEKNLVNCGPASGRTLPKSVTGTDSPHLIQFSPMVKDAVTSRGRQTESAHPLHSGSGSAGSVPDVLSQEDVNIPTMDHPKGHRRNPSDLFGRLFSDSPSPTPLNGNQDDVDTLHSTSTKGATMKPGTGTASGDNRSDDNTDHVSTATDSEDEPPSVSGGQPRQTTDTGEDDDIFEMNVEEAARRLQLE